MKPFVQTLLTTFAGTLVALAIVAGILYILPDHNKEDNGVQDKPIMERFLSYFDENGIPYEKLDDVGYYAFTYRNARGLLVYDPATDPSFLYMSMLVGTDTEDHIYLLERANQIEQSLKYVKMTVDEENQILFHIEQYVDVKTDINRLMDCMLVALRRNLDSLIKDEDTNEQISVSES